MAATLLAPFTRIKIDLISSLDGRKLVVSIDVPFPRIAGNRETALVQPRTSSIRYLRGDRKEHHSFEDAMERRTVVRDVENTTKLTHRMSTGQETRKNYILHASHENLTTNQRK